MTDPNRSANKPNAEYDDIPREEQVRHMLECALSFEYFVDHFGYIYDKVSKTWIRFEMWEAQREAAALFANPFVQRLIVLKTRQIGLTWLAVLWVVWHMLFEPIANVLIFSKTEREAIAVLRRIKGVYERLPSWMQAESIETNKEKHFALSNESAAIVLPRTGGDSYAATAILFDEADHAQDFGTTYNRARPAAEGGGRIFIISTSNKDLPQSVFKTMFRQPDEEDLRRLFIPYQAHPERTTDWYEKTKQTYLEDNGSLDEFYAHYPATPEEALQGRTLNKFFPPQWVQRAHEEMQPLYVVGRQDRDLPEGLPVVPGLIVYEEPRPGGEYVIACDTAEGDDGDETAMTVLDALHMVEVAHYSGQLDADSTGNALVELSLYYNRARVMIERNNHGHTVISVVKRSGRGVPIQRGLDKKLGWLTNVVGKPSMYNFTHKALKDWAVVIRTEKTLIQLQSIQRSDLSAPPNMNDDCADSFALAVTAVLFREQHKAAVGYMTDL